MKKIILPFFPVFIFVAVFSQQQAKITYLLVRMDESIADNLFKKKIVSINAENGNPYAKDIYSLRIFDATKIENNATLSYYDNTKDSVPCASLYNYFQNTTQALLFLSGKGWELISVTQEVSSSYSYERDPTGKFTLVPSIISKPIYYFKKVIIGK